MTVFNPNPNLSLPNPNLSLCCANSAKIQPNDSKRVKFGDFVLNIFINKNCRSVLLSYFIDQNY